jgi:hypothetical protein
MAVYYAAVTGNSGNSGAIGSPWPLQYGINQISPGDTLWVRGGTYSASGTHVGSVFCVAGVSGKNGSSGSPYNVFAYTGETVIIDGINVTTPSYHKAGFILSSCSYWHIKGINVTNVKQDDVDYESQGIRVEGGHHNTFELCIGYANEGPGFRLRTPSGHETLFLNCDAYDNYDPLKNGDDADGFDVGFCFSNYIIRLTGCRAWDNSDDGYDLYQYSGYTGVYYMTNCWAWNNGWEPGTSNQAGDGNGFKLGLDGQAYTGVTKRYLYNCLAVGNRTRGFSQESARVKKEFYNCIATQNGSHGFSFGWTGDSSGFEVADICRNNVSFGNTGSAVENLHGGTFYATRISDHNSWDPAIAVTASAADFITVDANQLYNSRQVDGSLPVLGFLHLVAGSDLIDAGDSSGIYATDGDAQSWHTPYPSIGAFELTSTDILVESIAISSAGGATTISTQNGTLQMYVYVLPGDATDPSVTWSVINGTGSADISVGGLVTAITDGTITVRATANDVSGVFDTFNITISNQSIIPVATVTVTGAGSAITISVNKGTLQMTATISPSNATDKTVVWSVINGTGSATINQSGLLTAITDGTVTVKATSNG